MRILLANKFYYRRAGAEAYLLDLEAALKRSGHEVAVFASAHPENLPCAWEKYFPPYRDYSRGWSLAKFRNMVWSPEAAKRIRWLIRDFKPEVAHFQNIYHHLSPSIIAECNRAQVPVALTVHDYKLICPNYSLFTDHAACERCHLFRYWNAVRYKCVKGSRAGSAAAAAEEWIHRALKIYETGVARFVTPSDFTRETLIRWGKNPAKIVHLPNLLDLTRLPAPSAEVGTDVLYVGRLEEWKGVKILPALAAAAPDIRFKAVGSGPLAVELKERVRALGLNNLEILGFAPREKVYEEIKKSRVVVVPSLGYDPFPTAALEAGALGRPVVGSRIGGIPEIVREGETGLLVAPGDEKAFLDALRKLEYDAAFAAALGAAAAVRVRALVDPERHLQKLLALYGEIIEQNRVSRE